MSSNWVLRVASSTAVKKIIAGGFTVFGVAFRTGKEALLLSAVERTITLATAMPNTSFAVIACIGNDVDTRAGIMAVSYTIVDSANVKIRWGEPLDGSDYTLSYLFIGKNTT